MGCTFILSGYNHEMYESKIPMHSGKKKNVEGWLTKCARKARWLQMTNLQFAHK